MLRSLGHSLEPSATRVESLDWLRALAIVLVVIGHSNHAMAPGGPVGVSVFFALSGYLIASILLRDGMLMPRNLAVFFVRRVARIYPLYLFTIAAMCLYFYVKAKPELGHITPYLWNILILRGDADAWVGYSFGVLWTLRVEFWFYLTFPIILMLGVLTRQILLVFLVAAGFSLAAKAGYIWPPLWHFMGNTALYYDHFLAGAAVAALLELDAVPKWLRSQRLWMVGAGLLFCAAVMPYPGARNLIWYAQSLAATVGTALLIMYWRLYPPQQSLPAIAFVGRISYSMYLVHAVLLDVLPIRSNIPCFLIVVLLLSTCTYVFIEQPVIRFAHRRFRFSRHAATRDPMVPAPA